MTVLRDENSISAQARVLIMLLNGSLSCDAPGRTYDSEILQTMEEVDVNALASYVIGQRLTVMVYDRVSELIEKGETAAAGYGRLEALKGRLERDYYTQMRLALYQDEGFAKAIDALTEAGSDCMPLKGWEERKIYPGRIMRSMTDLDILIRDFDQERLCKVMEELGYTIDEITGEKHEVFYNNKGITIEVHRRLNDRLDHAQKWERDLWDRASVSPEKERLYTMSPEDIMIHHMIHMEAGVVTGTLPVRAICDIHCIDKAYPDMDRKYVNEQLEKMDALPFCRQMTKLANACFSDEEIDDDMALLLNYYIGTGLYGRPKLSALGRTAKVSESHANLNLWRVRIGGIFSPMEIMKERYPILKRYPALLPVCWVRRGFKMTIGFIANRHNRNYRVLKGEELKEMREVLKAAGVLDQ